MPPSVGLDSGPVLAPKGTKGTEWRAAISESDLTSSTLEGSTDAMASTASDPSPSGGSLSRSAKMSVKLLSTSSCCLSVICTPFFVVTTNRIMAGESSCRDPIPRSGEAESTIVPER